MIWEAIYLSIPTSKPNNQAESTEGIIQCTAGAIARYDIQLAKSLVGDSEITIQVYDPTRASVNQLVLDPDGLSKFLADLENSRLSAAFHPRKVIMQMLTQDKNSFWKAVSKPSFLNWESQKYEDY